MGKRLSGLMVLAFAAVLALCMAPTAFAADSLEAGAIATAVTVDYQGVALPYSFTAEEPGLYTFYSEGDLDTYLDVYADAEREIYVDSDDDNGSETNFSVSVYMKAGNTYYLYPRLYSSNNAGSFALCVGRDDSSDYNDISNWNLLNESTAYIDAGGFNRSGVALYTGDYSFACNYPASTLVLGEDLEATFEKWNEETYEYEKCSGEPEESGYYRIVLTPLAGSGYTGSYTAELYVADYRELSNWGNYCTSAGYFDFEGYHEPKFVIYHQNDDDNVYLEQGKDFTIAGRKATTMLLLSAANA